MSRFFAPHIAFRMVFEIKSFLADDVDKCIVVAGNIFMLAGKSTETMV